MISSVVLTKNEEKNIKECLAGLKWCDEVIVIDDYSEDGTVKIAESFGAKIYKRKLENDFANQRNFGLEKARGDWVLFVDADERITPVLRAEVTQLLSDSVTQYGGFYLKRRDFIWGRELKHGETGNIKLLRLARKGAGLWKRRIHEVWEIEGNIGTLRSPLLHHSHQTLREFLADIDWMSTLHAQENKKEGKKSSPFKIVLYPKFKFIENWILKLGFLDGVPGLLVALLMSFHSYLAWSKLWLAERRNE